MTSSQKKDIRAELGLRPIINVCGPMTALGASIGLSEVAKAAADILPQFVEINDLHAKASRVIADVMGAEAGFVTACASAGITLSIAGVMTGANLARVEQLPNPSGLKNEVVIQMGHMIGYGAPIEQAVRLAGASVVPVGNAIDARHYQLDGNLNEKTAAALYVVSFHTVQYGQIPLNQFVQICHAKNIPVIVDLASECDLTSALNAGADIVIYSAHKFLAGLTAGIVAGRKDLVRAAFLQNYGIGRGMKVGKEAIVGAMAALKAWRNRDLAGERKIERGYVDTWIDRFSGFAGVKAEAWPDPTGNPIDRVKLSLDAAVCGITAWDLADALAAGSPPVIVRDQEVECGFFEMDPCHLHPGEADIVAERVVAELKAARGRNAGPSRTIGQRKAAKFDKLLHWPD